MLYWRRRGRRWWRSTGKRDESCLNRTKLDEVDFGPSYSMTFSPENSVTSTTFPRKLGYLDHEWHRTKRQVDEMRKTIDTTMRFSRDRSIIVTTIQGIRTCIKNVANRAFGPPRDEFGNPFGSRLKDMSEEEDLGLNLDLDQFNTTTTQQADQEREAPKRYSHQQDEDDGEQI